MYSLTTKTLNENTTIKRTNKTTTKKFNEIEDKIINAIYNEPKIWERFDKDNLNSFEVLQLKSSGYYKSKPNIRYIIVEYLSSCKDGTFNCDNLDKNKTLLKEDGFLLFWIAIDMNTYSILDIMTGISVSTNSDWIPTEYKIK